MGTIRNGGNGAFSGKAGSFVGSSWKNVSYIKGIPKLSNKPATQRQLDQRRRFAVAVQYLGPIKDVLNIGYKGQTANRATGLNMAVQYTIANAIVGDYPDYAIDPAKVMISKGALTPPNDVVIDATASGKLLFNWFVNLNLANAYVDDAMNILIYNANRQMFLTYEPAAVRNDGALELQIPVNFAGEQLFVYAFFQQRDSGRCSNSIFAGEVTAA